MIKDEIFLLCNLKKDYRDGQSHNLYLRTRIRELTINSRPVNGKSIQLASYKEDLESSNNMNVELDEKITEMEKYIRINQPNSEKLHT